MDSCSDLETWNSLCRHRNCGSSRSYAEAVLQTWHEGVSTIASTDWLFDDGSMSINRPIEQSRSGNCCSAVAASRCRAGYRIACRDSKTVTWMIYSWIGSCRADNRWWRRIAHRVSASKGAISGGQNRGVCSAAQWYCRWSCGRSEHCRQSRDECRRDSSD